MEEMMKPFCPYCRAEWTDDMGQFEDTYMSTGCATCGCGTTCTTTLKIYCDKCKKLIYVKEGIKIE